MSDIDLCKLPFHRDGLQFSYVQIQTRGTSRFLTGVTFVFCSALSFRAVEAIKAPVPHNAKQSKTIVIFTVKVMDRLQFCPTPSPRSLSQSPQISKAINSAAMSVVPARLQRVAADQIEAREVEAPLGVVHVRPRDITEHVRFAATRRTRTCTPEKLEIEIRFRSVIPSNSQLVSDLLNVGRFKAHFGQSRIYLATD